MLQLFTKTTIGTLHSSQAVPHSPAQVNRHRATRRTEDETIWVGTGVLGACGSLSSLGPGWSSLPLLVRQKLAAHGDHHAVALWVGAFSGPKTSCVCSSIPDRRAPAPAT